MILCFEADDVVKLYKVIAMFVFEMFALWHDRFSGQIHVFLGGGVTVHSGSAVHGWRRSSEGG